MKFRDYVRKTTRALGAVVIALALALFGCDASVILAALRWWWARWR